MVGVRGRSEAKQNEEEGSKEREGGEREAEREEQVRYGQTDRSPDKRFEANERLQSGLLAPSFCKYSSMCVTHVEAEV